MFSSKWLRVGIHMLAWLLFFSLMLSFQWAMDTERQGSWNTIATPDHLLFVLLFPALFYLNEYLFFPKLFLRKKYGTYFFVVAILLTAVFFLRPFDRLMQRRQENWKSSFERSDRPPFREEQPPRFSDGRKPPFFGRPPKGPNRTHVDIVSIVLFLMTFSSSASLRLTRQWRLSEKRAAQAEADKANAELSFLKAQIHPHFLFNTLNNIYSLAVIKNEQTARAILQLSEMMRYLTDEVRQNFVPLASEVSCIKNYIDLQKLRLNEKTTVEFLINGNLEGKHVPPLVFMTFVENIFKYGISSHEFSPVSIQLSVTEETISFYCQNKIFNSAKVTDRKGVGIANTRKRLEYLYPYKHLLNIAKDEHYTVHLTLQL